MSALDKLARDVEQLEAGAESIAKVIMIMWNNLYMSEESKVSIINNYINASFRANKNNNNTGREEN